MALTAQQERAAALVADGSLIDADIAATVKTSRATLSRWKALPAFAERVAVISGRAAALVERSVLETKAGRINELADRHRRLRDVIAARAEDKTLRAQPGGATGLLHVATVTKTGERLYGVDTALLGEMRQIEKQAAVELGQWTEQTKTENVTTVTIRSITAVQPAVKAPVDGD